LSQNGYGAYIERCSTSFVLLHRRLAKKTMSSYSRAPEDQ